MERFLNTLPSASARIIQDSEYLCASKTNVSNFVSVKLSGNNYLLWRAQMLCLLDSNKLRVIVDSALGEPRYSSSETMIQYNSLVKGWIFGSVSEDVLVDIFNLESAKSVWEKLKSIYDPTVRVREDSTSFPETREINTVSEEIEDTQKSKKKKLLEFTIKGDWFEVEILLKEDKGLATEEINSDGSTILHIAVGIGHNHFLKKMFPYLKDKQGVLIQRVSDGSTPLHIAALVGNKHAAELLLDENRKLLRMRDSKGEEALHKAYKHMHLDTIGFLLKAINTENSEESHKFEQPSDETAVVDLLVNAVSAKQYSLASELMETFPKYASKSDGVLMAIATSFPRELDGWEKLVYPEPGQFLEDLREVAIFILRLFEFPFVFTYQLILERDLLGLLLIAMPFLSVLALLVLVGTFIWFLIEIVRFIFALLYFVSWKCAKILSFAPIKQIEYKKTEWTEAKTLLVSVCDEIDMLSYKGAKHHPYYKRPILEAASHNAYTVVDEILFRAPDSIESTDKKGYDIIHLAIINGSEKIYNLIYDIGERKNVYRTYKDSFGNNIVHLAGRMSPSTVIDKKTGAVLQLQRELQWREEVKKFVFPTYITQENIFKETPDMLFRREHGNLVKEGEQWMKTTAESSSIAAALIITIVFAAAITVPGGSDEITGIPLFRKTAAFIIFGISDAISLFTSSTALLVFLSILTTRFAEKDFLVSLPSRLFIGLFLLLLSTTSMMIAFSATVFIVFGDDKLWMLAPICGLAIIPIAFFVALQFPLMVDLFRSTYIPVFGQQRKSKHTRFNPDVMRLHFETNFEGRTRRADNEEGDIPMTRQTNKYAWLRK